MAESTSWTHSPSGNAKVASSGHVSDEELFRRLDQPWRDDLLDDLGDKNEVIGRILDLGLESLRRSNAIARRMVEDSTRFRREFDARMAELDASQNRTRAMIEELVHGG